MINPTKSRGASRVLLLALIFTLSLLECSCGMSLGLQPVQVGPVESSWKEVCDEYHNNPIATGICVDAMTMSTNRMPKDCKKVGQ